MKNEIAVQYLSDSSGSTKAVQLGLKDWEKVLEKLNIYEQTLKIQSGLKEAFEEVATLKKSKAKKQVLTEFLSEL